MDGIPGQFSSNEKNRLNALYSTALLDMPPSRNLMTLAELAKQMFGVDVVTVTLVDKHRQWFKVRLGLDVCETDRDISFCTHTIKQNTPLVIADASEHVLFSDNPLVVGEPYIRFYSGVPLRSAAGYKLGAFCLIHSQPKTLTRAELVAQEKLAKLIEQELHSLSKRPQETSPSADEVNQSILRAQNVFLETDDERQTFDLLLSDLLSLTGSGFGYIAEVQGEVEGNTDNRYLKMKSISNIAWDKATNRLYQNQQAEGMEFRQLDNLLGEPLRIKDTVIANDFAGDERRGGLPHGHPAISNYCAVPILSNNAVIGVIGLANRTDGYSLAFVQAIEAITLTIGTLIQRNSLLQERGEYSRRVYRAAYFDEVTGLPNRHSLNRFAESSVNSVDEQPSFSVCYMDLDGFKQINDSLGHAEADKLLAAVARRLENIIKPHDFIARISGDEFILMTKSSSVADHQHLLNELQTPFYIEGNAIKVSASMGVAKFPDDSNDFDQVLRYADQAMFVAKQQGKNRFVNFDLRVHTELQRKSEIIKEVQKGIAAGQFEPYLQPKIELATRKVVGFEVLSRWHHPEQGIRMPGEFIAALSETRAQVDFDDHILAMTESLLEEIDGYTSEPVGLNINISPEYFNSDEFIQRVTHLAKNFPKWVSRITLEIVESNTLGDLADAVKRVNDCRALGFKVSLDDFGTNFSSLTYFRRLPVDEVKIDRSFIKNILIDEQNAAIVSSVIAMAKAFKRNVVAEGVETEEQLNWLQQQGCQQAQGFYFSRPKPVAEILAQGFDG